MAPTVGIVGLGKLGLPTAITMAIQGIEVRAYDVDPERMTIEAISPQELSLDRRRPLRAQVVDGLGLRFCDLTEVVNGSDCVLIAVETPHGPLYEGVTPLPGTRADFSYDALISAVESVSAVADDPTEIGIISTVLPGTIRGKILPLLDRHTVIYCPQFIAMGTVAHDLCNPEFTLLGYSGKKPGAIRDAFERMSDAPVFEVSHETAELAKVVYNTFISAKVTVANVVQETAHRIGASAADVFAILGTADRRLASSAYIGPGMGDGGPCHPRDNIALSWLARDIGMGADLFSAIMLQRQAYIEWLCDLLVETAAGRPLVLFGTAYKPGTEIDTGSSAVLLANMLRARGESVAIVPIPDALESACLPEGPAAFFIGCPEQSFLSYDFPAGSVVLDPWHRVERSGDVEVVLVGEPGV